MLKRICLVVVFSCLPSSLTADLIYNNGGFGGSLQLPSFLSTSTFWSGTQDFVHWQVADDFMLDSGTQWFLNGASFTGGIIDAGGLQPIVGETFDFEILIYADDGNAAGFPRPAGSPGLPYPGDSIAAVQATATATQVIPPFSIVGGFEVSFDPILLAGGTDYWFSVYAVGDFSFNGSGGSTWSWFADNSFFDDFAAFGNSLNMDWDTDVRNFDFQLFGNAAIPEPSSFLAVLLMTMSVTMRRRK